MEFPIQSHYLADISMKKLCHQSIAYITMEWRGQQHAREAVHYAKSYRPFELFVNENYKL